MADDTSPELRNCPGGTTKLPNAGPTRELGIAFSVDPVQNSSRRPFGAVPARSGPSPPSRMSARRPPLSPRRGPSPFLAAFTSSIYFAGNRCDSAAARIRVGYQILLRTTYLAQSPKLAHALSTAHRESSPSTNPSGLLGVGCGVRDSEGLPPKETR